jgi:hypothetical protein
MVRPSLYPIALVIACSLFLWAVAIGAQTPRSLDRGLGELNKTFTYRGKPIHPRAIQDLTQWVADKRPGPLSLDVAGTYDSNRYFGEYTVQENGNVFVDLTQDYVKEEGWFAYKYLGRLANGLHVLHTFDNGGGTGVFESLVIVDCVLDFEYTDHATRRPILVIRRRGSFGIGDRYDGKIWIDSKHNRINVSRDTRNIEKAFTIRIGG